MTIKIETKGLAELKAKIKTLFSGDGNHIVSFLMLRVGRYVQGELQGKPYAPERPNQTYERTGELNREWQARIKGRETVSVINPAKLDDYYAEAVVGENQAWMHADRWWQAREVAEEALPRALEETEEYAKSVWDG